MATALPGWSRARSAPVSSVSPVVAARVHRACRRPGQASQPRSVKLGLDLSLDLLRRRVSSCEAARTSSRPSRSWQLLQRGGHIRTDLLFAPQHASSSPPVRPGGETVMRSVQRPDPAALDTPRTAPPPPTAPSISAPSAPPGSAGQHDGGQHAAPRASRASVTSTGRSGPASLIDKNADPQISASRAMRGRAGRATPTRRARRTAARSGRRASRTGSARMAGRPGRRWCATHPAPAHPAAGAAPLSHRDGASAR